MNDDPLTIFADPATAPCDMAFVSNLDGALADAVVAQLAVIYPSDVLRRFASVELAAEGSTARIVLAMLPPIEDVARRLAAGTGADSAVAAWLAATEPLVEVSRRHRRRLWCVDARSVAAGVPAALALPGAVAGTVAQVPAFPLPPTITLVMAELLIAHHPAATRLAMEISAMVRGPAGVAVSPALLSQAQTEVVALSLAHDAQQAELLRLRDALTRQFDRTEAHSALREAAVSELTLAVGTARMALAEQDKELQLLRDTLMFQIERAELEAARRAECEAEVARLTAEAEAVRVSVSEQQ